MRPAQIDIIASAQPGAFRLERMVDQAAGRILRRTVEARHLDHGFVLERGRSLDAKQRVGHPTVDVVGAVREHGQLRIDRALVGAELLAQREPRLVDIKPRLMTHPQRHAATNHQIADAVVEDAVALAPQAVGQRGGKSIDPAACHQLVLQRLIDGGDERRPADGLVGRHRQRDDVGRRHAAPAGVVAGELHGVGLVRVGQNHDALRETRAVILRRAGRGDQQTGDKTGESQPSARTVHIVNVEGAGRFSRPVSPGLLFPPARSYVGPGDGFRLPVWENRPALAAADDSCSSPF